MPPCLAPRARAHPIPGGPPSTFHALLFTCQGGHLPLSSLVQKLYQLNAGFKAVLTAGASAPPVESPGACDV